MATWLDDMGMDAVHTPSATKEPVMAKKLPRKNRKKKKPAALPVMAKKSGRRFRKGLSMKIAADGSMHVRHMSESMSGLAIMPPVEIQVAGLED